MEVAQLGTGRERRITLRISIGNRLGLMNLLSGFKLIISRHFPGSFLGVRKNDERKPVDSWLRYTGMMARLRSSAEISASRARQLDLWHGGGV